MKLKLRGIIIVLLLMFALSTNVLASNLDVTLPTFKIKINNVEIDNENREYPLIVYQDITYFPLTFHDSRFLGLATKWHEATGLKVNKSEGEYGYLDCHSSANKAKDKATMPYFNIEINGQIIENTKEEYPLILFRDVTYFPLTWRFAVAEFGWDYQFTEENGLEINSSEKINLKIAKVKLPLADQRDFQKGAFTVAGDYFYFAGEKGIIYQTPIAGPKMTKAVYELPMWSYGESYVYPHLQTDGGRAMLTYHQGGATMGTDYRIILNDDGTNETFAVGYLNRKVFDEITVNVSHFPPPFPHNLSIKQEGEAEFKAIGSANYVYGWVKNIGQSRSNDLYRIGDEIYILAYKFNDVEATTGIHRVNIKTGETRRICEQSVQKFVLEGELIYFMDLPGYLYQISLDGRQVKKLTDFPVSDFTVLDNLVYYVTKEDEGSELFQLGEKIAVNPGGRVCELVKTAGYVYCIFADNAPAKLIVFNETGLQVFKTKAKIRLVSLEQNRLFYHQ